MRPEAKRGLEPLINRLIQHSLLRPCNYPCNIPILAIRKLNGDERLVQDFQLINETVIPLYPIIWNPYTLQGQIPPDSNWFSVLDLKDPFFCIPVHSNSQYPFVFECRILVASQKYLSHKADSSCSHLTPTFHSHWMLRTFLPRVHNPTINIVWGMISLSLPVSSKERLSKRIFPFILLFIAFGIITGAMELVEDIWILN